MDGVHFMTIHEALQTWANECDGKNENEIKLMKLNIKIEKDWFDEVKEDVS
jgi:hypothetical protein